MLVCTYVPVEGPLLELIELGAQGVQGCRCLCHYKGQRVKSPTRPDVHTYVLQRRSVPLAVSAAAGTSVE
jgi:hypothetical protein